MYKKAAVQPNQSSTVYGNHLLAKNNHEFERHVVDICLLDPSDLTGFKNGCLDEHVDEQVPSLHEETNDLLLW